MIVLITGSRTYADRDFIFATLTQAHRHDPITFMSLGDAKGVDSFAREWAEENNVDHIVHIADWSLGKRAGFLRNQEMLNTVKDMDPNPFNTFCVAFTDKPLSDSRGTNMMCKLVLDQTDFLVRAFVNNTYTQIR